LAVTLDELHSSLPAGRATLLMGVMRDKEVDAMLTSLARSSLLADARFIASGVPDSERALPAADLAAAWGRALGADAATIALDDADEALAGALDSARTEGGLLVVAGSLYLVGHVRARLLPAVSAA
jgi:dihydrofolate synthase/folylpolyglutamate synthase